MSSRPDRVPEQPMFGRRLRALRVARGLSQAQLAGSEISAAYLSRLESGARPPTPRVLSYLCTRLDVTPSAFRVSAGGPLARALATVTTVGESPQLAAVLENALLQEQDGDAVLRWQAQWLLARCYQMQGRAAEGLRQVHELTELSDEIDLPDLRARSRIRLARMLRDSGDLARARDHASEALVLAEQEDLPRRDRVEALMTLISLDAENGQLVQARERADRLVDTLNDEIPVRLQVEALWTAATVCVRHGDRPAADETMKKALDRMSSNDDPVLWMRVRLAAASMYLQMDPRDTLQARLRLKEAGSVTDVMGLPLLQYELLVLEAQLAFHEGDFIEAREISNELAERGEGLGMRERVRLGILDNQLAIIEGNRADAVAGMERIAKEAQETGSVELQAEVWRALAEALKLAEGKGHR
ncbi:helix-turn-helix domain-containing protein [Streptomyces sp. F63]|uniref:helix-turn-helix domain-containing protein n=1 Tax=Streptomyces sp. F63 TaxID=2824887 RepID=UPI001B3666E7|nr:helix-turn-helix domain-containing protein [Streptomyces sp. F63]MBQ0983233.1 helix-turn-helix domain-containing protein [Streptomyces sp. F63]